MAFIDREYDFRRLFRRLATTKNGDTCCMSCRRRHHRKPKCDRGKNHRRAK